MNGENAKFIFQWEPLDKAIGLGARILLEAISGFLLKYYQSLLILTKKLTFLNYNKFLIAIRHQYQHKDKNN